MTATSRILATCLILMTLFALLTSVDTYHANGRKRHIRRAQPPVNRQLIAFGERTVSESPYMQWTQITIKIAMINAEKRLRDEVFIKADSSDSRRT